VVSTQSTTRYKSYVFFFFFFFEKNVMPPPVQSRSVACDGGTMAE
jgi:hypothetical protein